MKKIQLLLLLITTLHIALTHNTNQGEQIDLGEIHAGTKLTIRVDELFKKAEKEDIQSYYFDLKSKDKEAVIVNLEGKRAKVNQFSSCNSSRIITLDVEQNYFAYLCSGSNTKPPGTFNIYVYTVTNWTELAFRGLPGGFYKDFYGHFGTGTSIFLTHNSFEYISIASKSHKSTSYLYSYRDKETKKIQGSLEKVVSQEEEVKWIFDVGEEQDLALLFGEEYALTAGHNYPKLNFVGFFRRVKDIVEGQEEGVGGAMPKNSVIYHMNDQFEFKEIDLNGVDGLKGNIKISNINDMEVLQSKNNEYLAYLALMGEGAKVPSSRFFECKFEFSQPQVTLSACRELDFKQGIKKDFDIHDASEIDFELRIDEDEIEVNYILSMLCLIGYDGDNGRKSHFFKFFYKENKETSEKSKAVLAKDYPYLANLGIGSKLLPGYLYLDTGSNLMEPRYHAFIKYEAGEPENIEKVFHLNATSAQYDAKSGALYAYNHGLLMRYGEFEELYLEINSRIVPEDKLDREIGYQVTMKKDLDPDNDEAIDASVIFNSKRKELKNKINRGIKIRQPLNFFTRVPVRGEMIEGLYNLTGINNCSDSTDCFSRISTTSHVKAFYNNSRLDLGTSLIFKNRIIQYFNRTNQNVITIYNCIELLGNDTVMVCRSQRQVEILKGTKINIKFDEKHIIEETNMMFTFGSIAADFAKNEMVKPFYFMNLLSMDSLLCKEIVYDKEKYGEVTSYQLEYVNGRVYLAILTGKRLGHPTGRLHLWTLDLKKEDPFKEMTTYEFKDYNCFIGYHLSFRDKLMLTFADHCKEAKFGRFLSFKINLDGVPEGKGTEIEMIGHDIQKDMGNSGLNFCAYEDKIWMKESGGLTVITFLGGARAVKENLQFHGEYLTVVSCMKKGRILLNFKKSIAEINSRDPVIGLFDTLLSFEGEKNYLSIKEDERYFYIKKGMSSTAIYKYPRKKSEYFTKGKFGNFKLEFSLGSKNGDAVNFDFETELFEERPQELSFEVNSGFNLTEVSQIRISDAFKNINQPVFEYRVYSKKTKKEIKRGGDDGIIQIGKFLQKISDFKSDKNFIDMVKVDGGMLSYTYLDTQSDSAVYYSRNGQKLEKIIEINNYKITSLDAFYNNREKKDVLIIAAMMENINEKIIKIFFFDVSGKKITKELKFIPQRAIFDSIRLQNTKETVSYFILSQKRGTKMEVYMVQNQEKITKYYQNDQGKPNMVNNTA